ncbi:MAG TPA: orotidine-5'-phosphate decarboxylase [Acidimicrobiia bacterium]|nr:orotidine-5'-phosphate decarboxylase [Acidimicrobiia bacterium]
MNAATTRIDPAIRQRLALVLDLDDADAAITLASSLQPWFGVAKVGLELYTAVGPAVVARLRDQGFDVFLDLKLHDIPNTVERAARVAGRHGVSYLTVHAAGGLAMLRAAVGGLADGAPATGERPPVVLGVTVLTSDADASAFDERLQVALDARVGGIVCAVSELARVKRAHPELVVAVPGIRARGDDHHDQARVGTPGEVAALGADLLVVGRAVTAADDPRAAAARVHADIAASVVS